MKKKKKIIIIILLLCSCFLFSITTFARYSFSNVWNYFLESQKFYFTSDNLSNNQINTDTFWDGNSVHFNLKNYSNNDLISDNNISYQVECEVIDGDEECELNGTGRSLVTGVLSKSEGCVNEEDLEDVSSLNKTECETSGYTWEKSLVSNDLYFDITSDNEISDVSVRITATSISPFRKSMTGVFNLNKSDASTGHIEFRVNHYDVYDELVVSNTYNSQKSVSVSFDSTKRIVDVTNNMTILTTDNNSYVNSYSFSINGMTNEKFIFYSKDYLTIFNDIIVRELS